MTPSDLRTHSGQLSIHKQASNKVATPPPPLQPPRLCLFSFEHANVRSSLTCVLGEQYNTHVHAGARRKTHREGGDKAE
ncbi:hypothetical protein E2C01_069099 [Portunus trituberculatus]|uniref:Uncharacterized protein n=1 Tax=Portunus trituberculatus TaxID=210409 RepID=A0A5B7HY00_PORTR|nr:hypothetical protein [Portunus trituberculatus]